VVRASDALWPKHFTLWAIRSALPQGTATEVIEIIPPYVQTHLLGEQQASDPAAMPLEAFITEVMEILKNQPMPREVVVKRCEPLRYAAENGNMENMFQMLNAAH
jgi:uncharacterized oxidoreductase